MLIIINLNIESEARVESSCFQCSPPGFWTIDSVREAREKGVRECIQAHQCVYIVVHSLHLCAAQKPSLSLLPIWQSYTHLHMKTFFSHIFHKILKMRIRRYNIKLGISLCNICNLNYGPSFRL